MLNMISEWQEILFQMELMSYTCVTDRFIMAQYISPPLLLCVDLKKSFTIKVVTFPITYC